MTTAPSQAYLMDTYSFLSISAGPGTGALDLFVAGTDEVYVITPVDRGWRFSRVTRRGTVSVTVGSGRLLSGSRILDALRIAAACPGGGSELFAALKGADIPASPLRAPEDMLPDAAQLSSAAGTAIRHFLSGRDIERAMSFPAQRATAPYACTILAPATASLRPAAEADAAVTRITAPVERRYAVIYPEGVRPSAREIDYGEELTLTYFAEGMADATHHLVAGKPSPFVEYDGAAMRVRPISALGIKLDPLPTPGAAAAKEEDTRPASPSLPAPGPSDPDTRSVTLAIRFADDRVVRATMKIKGDTSEYKLLRSGMFHGHRARRLAVKAHGDESYLIDLRESDSDETPAPAAPQSQDTTPDPAPRRRRSTPWLGVLLLFVAIAIGIVAVSYLPDIFKHVSSYDDAADPGDNAVTISADTLAVTEDISLPAEPMVSLADTAAPPREAAEAAAIDPSADYAYLNRASVWQRDSLRTPAALATFDIFATGDLGRIPADPFLASAKCTNPLVKRTVAMIWKAKGSSTQTGNERALRRLEGKASIDFNELFDQLAGIQPADPNQRPMPSPARD